MRPLITLTAAIVATIAFGTVAASAAGPQLAQATPDETGGWAAPPDVTTAVLERHDAVLGRQVRSSAGEAPAEKATARQDQPGQASTSDGTGDTADGIA